MSNKIHISVVIPVYKSEDSLKELYNRLIVTLEQINESFEIIMINDNSPDSCWEIIKELSNNDNRLKGINLSKNFGQYPAITAGLDHAKGNWVVNMDCDLQDKPEEIINLYKKALEGYDIVIASRVNRQDNFAKKFFSKAFYSIQSYLTDTDQDCSTANYCILSRKVVEVLTSMRENLRFLPTMLGWVGFKSTAIEVKHAKRPYGSSSYNFNKLFNLAFDVMISFSDKPLRITAKLGLVLSFFSFLYAIWIFIRALLGYEIVLGWSSLIFSIWFLSGLIIFILGIIGIYINRIFIEVKKRPIYIIKEIYEQEKT